MTMDELFLPFSSLRAYTATMAKTPHPSHDPIFTAATVTKHWLRADSRIDAKMVDLVAAVESDFAKSQRVPSDKEIEILVTGGDDGEGDEELNKTFPGLNKLIASFF